MEGIRDSNGRYVSNGERICRSSLADLPDSNLEVILLYQRYGILPVDYEGIELVLIKTLHKKRRDKANSNFSFHVPGTRIYPAVRPLMNMQSNLDLKQSNDILYHISLDMKHKSICQTQGWVHDKEGGKTDINNAPVTRLRSNFKC